MKDYYILVNEEQTGPFDLSELEVMVRSGEIPPDTLYAKSGMESWEQLLTIVDVPSQPMQMQAELDPPEIEPDAEIMRCTQLAAALESISTYSTAAEWKAKVEAEIAAIPATFSAFDRMTTVELRNIDEARRRFEEESFLKRTFGDHSEEAAISRRLDRLKEQRIHLASIIQNMQEKLPLVPDSEASRDLLVKEIKRQIKDLKLKKKEATVAMTEIRKEARVASDGAGKTWLGFYDSELGASQRRGIRHAKEQALRPYEGTKESIERTLLRFERHLNWLESFEAE